MILFRLCSEIFPTLFDFSDSFSGALMLRFFSDTVRLRFSGSNALALMNRDCNPLGLFRIRWDLCLFVRFVFPFSLSILYHYFRDKSRAKPRFFCDILHNFFNIVLLILLFCTHFTLSGVCFRKKTIDIDAHIGYNKSVVGG